MVDRPVSDTTTTIWPAAAARCNATRLRRFRSTGSTSSHPVEQQPEGASTALSGVAPRHGLRRHPGDRTEVMAAPVLDYVQVHPSAAVPGDTRDDRIAHWCFLWFLKNNFICTG